MRRLDPDPQIKAILTLIQSVIKVESTLQSSPSHRHPKKSQKTLIQSLFDRNTRQIHTTPEIITHDPLEPTIRA